jgi:hypothetical protein
VFVGVSPLHASNVAVILNPNTNRLSPQFHCVFDDYFETVHHKGPSPPPQWEDLILKSRFHNDIEGDLDDTWDTATEVDVDSSTRERMQQPPDNENSAPSSLPDVCRSTPDEEFPSNDIRPQGSERSEDTTVPSAPAPVDAPKEDTPAPRRSSRVRKPVDRFTFDKAHGYSSIRHYTSLLIKCLFVTSAYSRAHHAQYAAALAMDPEFGILDGLSSLPPDFMTSNPWMFKAKKGSDPDTPTIREALTGPYHDEFLEAMSLEISELEAHKTWTVIKKQDVPTTTKIVPLTWAFKVKRWPSGLMRKIKARICVRGDLQAESDDNVWETYAPVASWSSIRMLTILALQRKWVTKQVDFSNAFVQAPLTKDVYVSLPGMFKDMSGIDSGDLCLKLNKSLYGMHEAPKLWSDYLEKGLRKSGFKPSHEDLGIYYGRGMAIAVYVDDVLFFGPDADEMEAVINELQSGGFELKREKDHEDTAYSFLGINITEIDNKIKMTQHGLIKKFLSTIHMENCNAKQTPCATTPLGTDKSGPPHSEDWSYASAVGMLMYLAGNAHPEIAFAVHQCARFTHCPKQ